MERTQICQKWPILLIIFMFLFGGAWGPAAGSSGIDPAPDPASMPMRGLGAEEIKALQAGEGMGLARPAELNGFPGPIHVLEAVRDGKLHLNPGQQRAVEQIHAAMKREPKALGQKILAAEAKLETGFRERRLTEAELQRQVEEIGRQQAALRMVHLRAHLFTAGVMQPEQIEEYNVIRGYAPQPPGHGHGH